MLLQVKSMLLLAKWGGSFHCCRPFQYSLLLLLTVLQGKSIRCRLQLLYQPPHMQLQSKTAITIRLFLLLLQIPPQAVIPKRPPFYPRYQPCYPKNQLLTNRQPAMTVMSSKGGRRHHPRRQPPRCFPCCHFTRMAKQAQRYHHLNHKNNLSVGMRKNQWWMETTHRQVPRTILLWD